MNEPCTAVGQFFLDSCIVPTRFLTFRKAVKKAWSGYAQPVLPSIEHDANSRRARSPAVECGDLSPL